MANKQNAADGRGSVLLFSEVRSRPPLILGVGTLRVLLSHNKSGENWRSLAVRALMICFWKADSGRTSTIDFVREFTGSS